MTSPFSVGRSRSQEARASRFGRPDGSWLLAFPFSGIAADIFGGLDSDQIRRRDCHASSWTRVRQGLSSDP